MRKHFRIIMFVAAMCLLVFSVVHVHTQPSTNAIARVWQGQTTPENAQEYEQYLKDETQNRFLSADGNLGIQVLRKPNASSVTFMVISYWESREAIETLVGGNIDQVVPLPRDIEFLIEPATAVIHYDIVLSRYN